MNVCGNAMEEQFHLTTLSLSIYLGRDNHASQKSVILFESNTAYFPNPMKMVRMLKNIVNS